MENLGKLVELMDIQELSVQRLSLFLLAFLLPASLLFFYARFVVRLNARLYPRIYNRPSQEFWMGFLRFLSLLWILFGAFNLLQLYPWPR
jgi:hypothetical protein